MRLLMGYKQHRLFLYFEKNVSAVIQFNFNYDDTFQFNALEFNEIPQNNFMASSLLEKMCGKESSSE